MQSQEILWDLKQFWIIIRVYIKLAHRLYSDFQYFCISQWFFNFFGEVWIFQWNVLHFSVKFFGFLYNTFWIFLWIFLYFSVIFFGFLGEIFWSHTAWAPEGRERQSQADPMGPKPVGVRAGGRKVGSQRAPRLLVITRINITRIDSIFERSKG